MTEVYLIPETVCFNTPKTTEIV